MSYKVLPWRDATGANGITIGTVIPVGWDNHVAEIILSDEEIDDFISRCTTARKRARDSSVAIYSTMPDAYDAGAWTA